MTHTTEAYGKTKEETRWEKAEVWGIANSSENASRMAHEYEMFLINSQYYHFVLDNLDTPSTKTLTMSGDSIVFEIEDLTPSAKYFTFKVNINDKSSTLKFEDVGQWQNAKIDDRRVYATLRASRGKSWAYFWIKSIQKGEKISLEGLGGLSVPSCI